MPSIKKLNCKESFLLRRERERKREEERRREGGGEGEEGRFVKVLKISRTSTATT